MNDISYNKESSDQLILQEIGNFIKQKRIDRGITQNQLARQAAVSRSTLSLIERGENIALGNLIKVLRMLDALYIFNEFKYYDEISPLKLAKGITEQRQRAFVRGNNKDRNELGW
jgi:transcriptional regulator with XRE-family HTH domain